MAKPQETAHRKGTIEKTEKYKVSIAPDETGEKALIKGGKHCTHALL
jgi:hypothetical protein